VAVPPAVAEVEAAVAAGKNLLLHTARAIVFRGEDLLVMNRQKHGRKYRALIGGKIELGESPEEAVIREALEETTLVLANPRHVFTELVTELETMHYFFLCEYTAGEPKLSLGSEEFMDNLSGDNLYQPAWLPLLQIVNEQNAIPFITPKLLSEILQATKSGFPERPKKWTT
jgi:8-oxo-dGTP pyrophosphatase MutT (NUDIX family)